MKKLTANVLHIVDVEDSSLLSEVVSFLKGLEPEYRDRRLKEDLYNIDEIGFDEEMDAQSGYNELSADAKAQIVQLQEEMKQNDAGYIRVTYF
jgi:hypothetical protein